MNESKLNRPRVLFSGYQEELIKKNGVFTLVKLFSIEDVFFRSTIADFFLNFDGKQSGTFSSY